MDFYIKLTVHGLETYVQRLGAIWTETVLVTHKSEARVFTANTHAAVCNIADATCNRNITIVPVTKAMSHPQFLHALDNAEAELRSWWNGRLLSAFGDQRAVNTFLSGIFDSSRNLMPMYYCHGAVKDFRLLCSERITAHLEKCAPIALHNAKARFVAYTQACYNAAYQRSKL